MNFLDSPTAAVFLTNAAHYGVDLVGAVVILVVGWWLSGWAGRSMHAHLKTRPWMDATLLPLLVSIIRYAIIIVAILAVLDQFGIQMTSLVAVLGAAGLAVGLALQGTLSNVAAGVMLVVLRPFHVGNLIQAAGFTGHVEEVGLFATVIRTDENKIITVPNKLLSDAPVINYSRLPVQAAINISFLLPYSADLGKTIEVLRKVAAEHHKEDALIGVDELGDAALKLRFSIAVPMADADAVKLSINLAIRSQLAAAGVQFMQEAAAAVPMYYPPPAQPTA
jgi:small conductance mechanosensitive channel